MLAFRRKDLGHAESMPRPADTRAASDVGATDDRQELSDDDLEQVVGGLVRAYVGDLNSLSATDIR